MTIQSAADNFGRAIAHCENLASVHRAHGGGGRGRRYQEVSLNRAIIVLAVAAWQSVVENLADAIIDIGVPGPGSPLSLQTYTAMMGAARKGIGDFSTPNADNSRRVFISVGFDPRPSWTWTLPGNVHWSTSTASQRLDQWLKVRHAIAHGHRQLPHVEALSWVREHPGSAEAPALRLPDAESCMKFVTRLAHATGDAAADHLTVARPAS